MSSTGTGRVRLAAAVVVGLLAGTVLIQPVSAHLNSPLTFGHLKKHFYTKVQADARFINVGEQAASAATAANAANAANADKLDNLDSAAFQGRTMWARVAIDGTILEQSGGISLVSGPLGGYVVRFPAAVAGKAIVATARESSVGRFVTVVPCGGGLGVDCGPGTTTSDARAIVYDHTGFSYEGAFYIVVLP